jgi:hypothetical protein
VRFAFAALVSIFALVAPIAAQCPPNLAPLDDQSNIVSNLQFYEVAPGSHIVLYNATAADIALSGSPYWFCSPFLYESLSSVGAGVVVPAFGLATVPWPGSFNDSAAGGELQLYKSSSFAASTDIIDFVCWGVNPHGSRLTQAQAVGKWSGACAPALSNGALRRRVTSSGKTAASYDTTVLPASANCTPACGPKLGPADDGSGIPTNLVFSEVRPGSYIELYNATGTAIALSSANMWLCSPFVYVALATIAPRTIVPAEGYAVVAWPTSFTDTPAGGELQLYAGSNFENPSTIVDFVCWGSNPHDSRKAQAESVGKWSGACAGMLSDGSIHRIPGSTGTTAASYDVGSAASPFTCPGDGSTPAPIPEPFVPLISQLRCSPNPFNPVTVIQFALREAALVRIRVYRADGSFVVTAFEGKLSAGEREIAWDGAAADGERLPSGVYHYRVEAAGEMSSGKLVLVE